MRTHDVICDADGWAHYVDGVKQRTFATWFMAMTAARKAAERDAGRGLEATFRYQSADGRMLPVQTRAGEGSPQSKPSSNKDVTTPAARWERARLQA